MKLNWKLILFGISMLVVGMITGKFLLSSNVGDQSGQDQHSDHEAEAKVWTCSMHPQIRQNEPGDCPICGMDLVPVSEGAETARNNFEMSKSAVQLSNVQTSEVTRNNGQKAIRLQGIVKEDERNVSLVTARFAGRLDHLEVNFTGAPVNKGDRLARVYSPQLVTAQRELLEALKLKDSNPQLYRASRSKLKLWSLTDEQINAIETGGEPQEHVDIHSPITGFVTKLNATLGEYVEEGSVLFHVTDLSKVWILFDAYEADLGSIDKGDAIKFSVRSIPGKEFTSKVSFIDPVLNFKTRTASIRVEAANPGWALKPGMFADGTIKDAGKGQGELMVPTSAVLWTGKRSVVYVKVPEKDIPTFEFREVILGSEMNGNYEILQGLSQGEEIVTNGTFKVDAAAQLAGKKSMMNRSVSTPSNHQHSIKPQPNNLHEVSFKVYGNCGMCKKRIEKAANSVSGVTHSSWDSDTQQITVHTDQQNLNKENVSEGIAKAGHDTEFHLTENSTYDDLPGCCQYERR